MNQEDLRRSAAPEILTVEQARASLHARVKAAQEGQVTYVRRRHDEAVLAPLDHLPAARDTGSGLATHTLTSAQRDLGDLVKAAAAGNPQVLLRRSVPVAVLLPARSQPPGSSSPALNAEPSAGHTGSPSVPPQAEEVAQETSSAMNATPRRLAALGDVIGEVRTSVALPAPQFGLADLDAAVGGLQPGRFVLVAAAPGAGGSLLSLAAARHTALVANQRVLYAASGLTRADVARRIVAAETGADYRRLATNTLTGHEHTAAQKAEARLTQAPLLIDDGSALTAEAIAQTAPYVNDLALIVVDRLQRAPAAHIPLSGDQLPAAARTLTRLARQSGLPVLAVIDTDDPHLIQQLDPDVTIHLTLRKNDGTAEITVAERDFGPLATARLNEDLAHARFTNLHHSLAHDVEDQLLRAALPFTSGARQGLPAPAQQILAAFRDAKSQGDEGLLSTLRDPMAELAANPPALNDGPLEQQLRTALNAYANANASASPLPPSAEPEQTASSAPRTAEAATVAHQREDAEPGEEVMELQPGDEHEPKDAVFPGLSILRESISRSKMHPLPAVRADQRENVPWTLFREFMDGEPRWVHPEVERVRNGAGKRDTLIVPDSFTPGALCTIDRNGSYPSACSAVPLAPNKLLHTGALPERTRDQAGIFYIDVPSWAHTQMPHPLGRLADRADAHGRVWAVTSHIQLIERLIKAGHIAEPLRIHDSWTGRANESLFQHFYKEARRTRTELVDAAGAPYDQYKRRLSIALRLLWPKGDTVKSPFWRPDWRTSVVAEASVRHWVTAWKAVQAGHTLIALRNVDEAVFHTPDGTAPDTYKIGTGFGEVKVKHGQENP
ncbi:type II toxin-antitoxin system prevent-host-death family antitoxin [Streptomyces sp. RB110-1]|uniref:type II toxin-antitoxin system prevent-host-death family antitoxin n=1 Tax=unclassified Streptomyces TaxID=2593676 RepID=UPI0019013ED9|nr:MULTISPECIES: type II toxin-antitoxin system prevent-host-death family antitoxin [unclassified Streptomyces]MBK0372646.1 type II toxin-antitoxin system prevent-host-death family antitoxin [Streptomyces sp. RB110-1]MBK0384636.1 type II toxin-antitoxin system prevent-host-death family antitoxin [Streptomyces sp. RB110-2]